MKIVFFGTPYYVLPILESLYVAFGGRKNRNPIQAVVTSSPKPSGRDKKIAYSPIDKWAHEKKIQIFYSPTAFLESGIKADIGVLASYGAIIPKSVINSFPKGILNIHPSLLPKWRGSSPCQATIVSGESQTGATIIKIDEQLDHGPIVSQFTDEVNKDDTTLTLRDRLFKRAAEVLPGLVDAYYSGKIIPKPQDHEKASITREIKKDDAFIPLKYFSNAVSGNNSKEKMKIPFMKDYSLIPSADSLNNFIRAMYSWPCAWTIVKIKGKELRLKITKSYVEEIKPKKYYLVPVTVQLQGKSEVSWEQFLLGYPEVRF